MKRLYALLLLLLPSITQAQHCPWDCSGMILLKTDVSPAEFAKLNPVLADGDKRVVIDTIYGTGKDTYDSCRFLSYDDFLRYRTEKIKLHYWYGYDTLYHFARGYYVIRYNYCRYKWDGRSDLFIRFNSLSAGKEESLFIAIPTGRRIHLHEYNMEINRRQTDKILSAIEPLIMEVGRAEWKLPEK
ncbi:MAG: hypothetical protein ACT4OJ_06650 [Bacteroidota bacterium]